MIYQQLYIDGILMDLDENTNIVLDIKSNLFRDVTKIAANNTYTINLPKTVHNMTAIDWAAKPKAGAKYPYVFHKARFFRNGLEIIRDGRLTLLSVSETIEVAIYWGIFPAFDKLQENNLKLNEMKLTEYLPFKEDNDTSTTEAAKENGVFYADYVTEQLGKDEDDWSGSTLDIKANKNEFWSLVQGTKIKTGETYGVFLSGQQIADESHYSRMMNFRAGTTATIASAQSSGEYRTFAVLDRDKKIILLAKDGANGKIILRAQSEARYLIVNSTEQTTVTLNVAEITGENRIDTSGLYRTKYRQPCVTTEWLLGRITASAGVDFRFPAEYSDEIKSLIVPIISNKADENTIEGELAGTFASRTDAGTLSLALSDSITAMKEQKGQSVVALSVLADCTLDFDIQLKYRWNVNNQGNWQVNTETGEKYKDIAPYYIEVNIGRTNQTDPVTYNVGTPFMSDGSVRRTHYSYNETPQYGDICNLISGHGKIELKKYDVVRFYLKNDDGTLADTETYDGFFKAGIEVGDEVPVGGNFPIGINLPDIEVLSFIKFLSLILGVFPRQINNSQYIEFVRYAKLWESRKDAKDWTKKLIPMEASNIPRKTEFDVSEYKQHNRYKWKEDEQTVGDYDADLFVNNGTLDYEQDVWTLPFAATDGNRIPIRSQHKDNGEGLQYSACKDRIVTLANGEENATLEFGINLQEVFDTRYKQLTKTVSNAHIITERFRLSDLEILNFDETVPVYLAQYGAYFAVTELKTTSNGYTEATLLQLEF